MNLPALTEAAKKLTSGDAGERARAKAALDARPLPRGIAKRTETTPDDLEVMKTLDLSASNSRTFRRAEEQKNAAIDLTLAADPDAKPWMSYIDEHSGKVIVHVETPTPRLMATLAKGIGADSVAVRVQPKPQIDHVSRPSDTPPFYGGARIYTPVGSCSDAFSWHSGSTQMMLTAGHCVPNGGSVSTLDYSMGSVNRSSEESWDTNAGTVFMTGQSTFRGDVAVIRSSYSTAGRMFRGGTSSTSSARVAGMASGRTTSGMKVCSSGASSGEVCVWTVTHDRTLVVYSDLTIARNVTNTVERWDGRCVIPGDSGGAMFGVNSDGSVNAHGVISGRMTGPGWCQVIFTDIYDAYYGLPGYLTTG